MYDPKELIRAYEKLAHGSARISGIQYAVQQADLAKDYPYMVYFRQEQVDEGSQHGDNRAVFFLLPEMLRIFKEHPQMASPPEYYGPAYRMLLFPLNYFLAKAFDYYQISKEDMDLFFQEGKEFFLEHGEPLLTYYEYCADFYRAVDPALAVESYEAFKTCRKNGMFECHACDADFEVDFELFLGNESAALTLAQPLFKRKISCVNTPGDTIGHFLSYYIMQNNLVKAAHYAEMLLKELRLDMTRFPFTGEILLVLAKTDVPKAWHFYKKYYLEMLENNNPYASFLFARGASVFWKAMSSKKTVPLKMPGFHPLYREEGLYETELLKHYYEERAWELARKFDDRNGTGYFTAMLTADIMTIKE